MNDISKKLRATMDYKWKIQTSNDRMATCVAYVDARQVVERLDEVIGCANWSVTYERIENVLYSRLSLYLKTADETYQWVMKMDSGTESFAEKTKGESSDAFKRSAVRFGVGAFLYELEPFKIWKTIKVGNKSYPADSNGKRIYDITAFVNKELGIKYNKKQMTGNSPQQTNQNKGVVEPQKNKPYKNDRYDSTKGGANVQYQKTHSFSPEIINRVKKLERDGKKGKEVLMLHIKAYNETNKTQYTTVGSFNNNELLTKLIDFVENIPPTEMK